MSEIERNLSLPSPEDEAAETELTTRGVADVRYRGMANPLDEEALEEERLAISAKSKEKIPNLVITRRKTMAEIEKARQLDLHFKDILTQISNLDNDPQTEEEAEIDPTMLDVLYLGGSLGLQFQLNQLWRLLYQEGYDEERLQYLEAQMVMYAKEVQVVFGETTTWQLNQGSKEVTKAIAYLVESWDFLMLPYVQEENELDTEKLAQTNQADWALMFPQTLIKGGIRASLQIQGLVDVEADAIHAMGETHEYWLPAIEMALRFQERLDFLREGAFKALFGVRPTKETQPLMEYLLPYLDLHYHQSRLLRFLNVTKDSDHLQTAYRKSRQVYTTPLEVEFYSKMQELIHEYVSEDESADWPLLYADVMDVIDVPLEYVGEGELVATLMERISFFGSTLRKQNHKLGRYEIELSEDQPLFNHLIKPVEISLAFNPNNTSECALHLTWEDEESEELLEVSLIVNAKQGKAEWSILEPIDDAESRPLAELLYLLLVLSLEHVLSKFLSELVIDEAPAKVEHTNGYAQSPRKRRQHIRDEIYELRKRHKQERKASVKQAVSGLNLSASPELLVLFQDYLKNTILYRKSELESLAVGKLEASLPLIEHAIHEFNEEGKGRFKKLVRAGGSEHYILKVNTPDGEVRVVCVKVESKGNGNLFEVEKVYRRDDAYKRLYRRG